MKNGKWDLASSVSQLESLGLQTPKLNELNDSFEIEKLAENLKQMLYQEYKSMPVFTDWLQIVWLIREYRNKFYCKNREISTYSLTETLAYIILRRHVTGEPKLLSLSFQRHQFFVLTFINFIVS